MLIFIDESGHPNPGDPCTRPVLLAVCVKESDAGRLVRAVYGIRRSLLGKMKLSREEQELKASAILNRPSILKNVAKKEFAESLFEYLRDAPLAVFAIVMERPPRDIYEGIDALQRHQLYLLQRIQRHMEREHETEMATCVYDDRDVATNKRFSECFTSFMARSETGKAMANVVPFPLFADSSLTAGIQIADLFAYVLRICYEQGLTSKAPVDDPYLSAIRRYGRIVREKTRDYDREDGQGVWYGIATMDASKFFYERPSVVALDLETAEEVDVSISLAESANIGADEVGAEP